MLKFTLEESCLLVAYIENWPMQPTEYTSFIYGMVSNIQRNVAFLSNLPEKQVGNLILLSKFLLDKLKNASDPIDYMNLFDFYKIFIESKIKKFYAPPSAELKKELQSYLILNCPFLEEE